MSTFKRLVSRSVGTTPMTIGSYTVAASTQVTIIGLVVSNTAATDIEVAVSLYDGANDTHFVKNCPIPVGGSVVVVGGSQKVVLETGDGVRVVSDTATSVDVVMSILEII